MRLAGIWMRLSAVTIACVLALGAAGCETEREAELLEVSGVQPARLSADRVIRVRGAGFPPGRPAVLRFEGTMRHPGEHPHEVSVELPGRAVAAEQIEARLTEEALRRLGGGGTLDGRVVAIFDAARGRGRVVGRSPELQIDVVSDTVERLHGELGRRRAASELIERLGLTLGEESNDVEGLPVALVRDRSPAAEAGVIAGDRLVTAEGVRAHRVSDVLGAPGADTLTLRLVRPGEAAPFLVVLPVGGTQRQDVRLETVRAVLIALAWVLLVLVLLAPTASAGDWIARAARSASNSVGGSRRARLNAWWKRNRRDVPLVAIGLVALALVPALDPVVAWSLSLETLVLALAGIRAAAVWLSDPGGGLRGRLMAVGSALLTLLAITIGLGAVATLEGTTDLTALSVQNPEPWRWTLLRTPVAIPAFALTCIAAAWRPKLRRRRPHLATLMDDLVLWATAALVVTMLFGGWGHDAPQGALRLERGLTFVVLSTGLWLWMRRARSLPRWPRSMAVAGLVLSLLILLWVFCQLSFEPADALTVGVARVLGGALGMLLVSATARGLSGRIGAAPAPLHRFV